MISSSSTKQQILPHGKFLKSKQAENYSKGLLIELAQGGLRLLETMINSEEPFEWVLVFLGHSASANIQSSGGHVGDGVSS
jgi:hypothetical protein